MDTSFYGGVLSSVSKSGPKRVEGPLGNSELVARNEKGLETQCALTL